MDETQRELREMAHRIMTLENNHEALKREVEANTALTKEVKQDTSDIVDLLRSMKTFVRFGKAVGKLLAWLAGVATGIGAIWLLLKGGKS